VSTCPNCGSRLYPAEVAEGRCTSCMKPLPSHVTADAPVSAPSSGDFSTSPREDWPVSAPPRASFGRSPQRWRLMRTGLLLMIWGLIVYLIANLLRVPASLATAGMGPQPASIGIVLGLGMAVLSLASLLLLLVGIGLCCTIPREAGAGGWVVGVILAVVAYVLEFVGLIAWVFVGLMGGMRGMPGLGGLGGMPFNGALLVVIGLMLITAFGGSLSLTMVFRAASLYWNDRGLAKSFVSYFILSWLIPVALGIALIALLAVEAGGPRGGGLGAATGISMVFGCAFLIYGLAMFIWLLTLLNRLRQLIPAASGRSYDEED
jgi:hypothetical protein